MRNKGTRTSNPATVGYKKARKPLMTPEERKRQAQSLIVRRPGGDDIA